jgi:hypothetical protein
MTYQPESFSIKKNSHSKCDLIKSKISDNVAHSAKRWSLLSPIGETTLGSASVGNLTLQKIWDSTKRSFNTSLSSSNSVSVSHVYDSYGNLTSTTDANGTVTHMIYGNVDDADNNHYPDLYPTHKAA